MELNVKKNDFANILLLISYALVFIGRLTTFASTSHIVIIQLILSIVTHIYIFFTTIETISIIGLFLYLFFLLQL